MPVKLAPLALLAGGSILTYTAIEDPDGGPLQVVRDLLSGHIPTPGAQLTAGAQAGAAAAAIAGKAGQYVPGTGAKGADVARVAMSWLGTPYLFGGMTRKGIDCSGLVCVAYKQAAGLTLPHFATAIGHYGHQIPRSAAAAGDVVLWGTPANYPHCAIAINGEQCIAAWTYGVGVAIKNIDIRAVKGYGLPVIRRLLPDQTTTKPGL